MPKYPDEFAGLLATECYQIERYVVGVVSGTYCVECIVGETHEAISTHERTFTLQINGVEQSIEICPSVVAQGHARAGIVKLDGIVADDSITVNFSSGANIYGLRISFSDASEFSREDIATAPSPLFAHPEPSVSSQAKRKILFIGHSGVFYWAIPETVQRMVQCAGHTQIFLSLR